MSNLIEIAEAAAAKLKPQPRTSPDRWQRTRLIVQSLFVLLNLFLCVQFYFFVRYFETGATGPHVSRPAGVDGWLPIAGLMNTRYLLATGHIPAIHPAAGVLFLIFAASSLLLKRAFCAWLCPVGTLSEYLWKLGRKLFKRNLILPRWLDIPLRGIKYLLMAFFVFIVGGMSATALEDFMIQPYGILADVKMLHFFIHMSAAAAVTVAVLIMLSVVIKNFWCRYACPYGALQSLASLFSPITIRRDAEACIACGKCSKACPQNIPVDRLIQVRSVECTACMECVSSCGTQNALQFALPPRTSAGGPYLPDSGKCGTAGHSEAGGPHPPSVGECGVTAAGAPYLPSSGKCGIAGHSPTQRWQGRALQPLAAVAILAALFFGGVSVARLTHHWQTNVPDEVYRQLIPHVDEAAHPGF